MVGPAQAHAVLDMLRAASHTPEANVPASAPMALWGYSQGGGAVTAAAEAAATYAPELPIKGVTAGGVPADLVATANFLNGGIGFGFLAAAATGFDAAYPELQLDKYLNDTGRQQLKKATTGSMCLWNLLLSFMFKKIADFTSTNPLTQPDWQARLAESKVGAKPPSFPAFLYHATFDEVIPVGQANALRQAWCTGGVKVQWQQYPVAEHILGEGEGAGLARTWIKDRFAGKPAPTNCQAG
jgi:predicted esterase